MQPEARWTPGLEAAFIAGHTALSGFVETEEIDRAVGLIVDAATLAGWGDVAALRAARDEARAAIRRAQSAIRNGAVSAGAVALALVGVGDSDQPSMLDERDEARARLVDAEAERDQMREALEREQKAVGELGANNLRLYGEAESLRRRVREFQDLAGAIGDALTESRSRRSEVETGLRARLSALEGLETAARQWRASNASAIFHGSCSLADLALADAIDGLDAPVVSAPLISAVKADSPQPDAPTGGHRYLSTACLHAAELGREHLHAECSTDATRWDGTHKTAASCKWCGAPCVCPCHVTEPASTEDAPVDLGYLSLPAPIQAEAEQAAAGAPRSRSCPTCRSIGPARVWHEDQFCADAWHIVDGPGQG